MDSRFPEDLTSLPEGCQNCHFVSICQSGCRSRQEPSSPIKLMVKIGKYERGDHVFKVYDPFKNLYVIRSGSVKTYSLQNDGLELVTGYHLAGTLLGLNTIGCGHHIDSALALETCSICEISFSKLENMRKQDIGLNQLIWHAMSDVIRDEQSHLRLLSRNSAAARLAEFLIKLSAHYKSRGYSSTNFNISLNRHDIASLLGLAVETVSRMFTQFQDHGLATIERKHIVLNDLDGMKRLACTGTGQEYMKPRARQHTIQNNVYPMHQTI